jgi:ABC transporter substrate binding protein (PQQ-dependent alcohol dehydrogenase system)
MAGKVVVAAALAAQNAAGSARTATPAPAAFDKAMAEASVDGSKGTAMSFRAWDGQLRQPVLLSDGVGVIGTAPIDGVLHARNTLDTLGADAPERLCKARP